VPLKGKRLHAENYYDYGEIELKLRWQDRRVEEEVRESIELNDKATKLQSYIRMVQGAFVSVRFFNRLTLRS
jgi:hypothetical protein